MSLVSVVTETFRRTKVQETEVPSTAPPEVQPMSKQDELRLLENEALKKGISNEEFFRIKREGNCYDQVQTRIACLHEWLAAHP